MKGEVPFRWDVGEPMIEWCARNGLDAHKIPADNNAITVRSDGTALVWVCDEPPEDAEVVKASADDEGEVFLVCVPIDSSPPTHPDWPLFMTTHRC